MSHLPLESTRSFTSGCSPSSSTARGDAAVSRCRFKHFRMRRLCDDVRASFDSTLSVIIVRRQSLRLRYSSVITLFVCMATSRARIGQKTFVSDRGLSQRAEAVAGDSYCPDDKLVGTADGLECERDCQPSSASFDVAVLPGIGRWREVWHEILKMVQEQREAHLVVNGVMVEGMMAPSVYAISHQRECQVIWSCIWLAVMPLSAFDTLPYWPLRRTLSAPVREPSTK